MESTTPSRRSKRARKPTKRYTNDAFEGLDLEDEELISALSPEIEPSVDGLGQINDSNDTDEEFNISKVDGDHVDEELIEDDDDDDAMIGDNSDGGEAEVAGSVTPTTPRRTRQPLGPKPSRTKNERYEHLVGLDDDDIELFAKNSHKWTADSIFPSRCSDGSGGGGLAFPFRYEGESREHDAKESWHWYYANKGREQMRKKQQASDLAFEQATRFYPRRHKLHRVLMGPYGQQKAFDIGLDSSVHLQSTWPLLPKSGPVRRTLKDGWVLNLGSRVRCLGWAPNHIEFKQYLAVALFNRPPSNVLRYDPFHPSEPWDSCIDIWEFSVRGGPQGTGYVDAEQPPRIIHSICSTWGLVRSFRWCHIARPYHVQDKDSTEHISIGLLAGVWSDGHARVIDVWIPRTFESKKVRMLYSTAAWTMHFPGRVCTQVAWKSDREILIGMSSGEILLFDISKGLQNDLITPSDALQVLTHLPSSYIVKLVSLAPYFPHLVSVSTLDGNMYLVDLRDPVRATVMSPRVRQPTSHFDFSPHVMGLFFTDDETASLRGIRNFATSAGKMIHLDAQATAISAGVGHASLLVGTASGKCVCLAPLRVLLARKRSAMQLTWFRHEWITLEPQVSKPNSGNSENTNEDEMQIDSELPSDPPTDPRNEIPDEMQDYILREGISRITEGYSPEPLEDRRDTSNREKTKKEGNEWLVWATIYEEESAITQLEWNPNAYVGGWAAAATACGLLRVEDLAI